MPLRLLTFCFCLTLPVIGFAQWEWLNPKPSGYKGNYIFFTNQSLGYILNENGDLLQTANAGNSWNQKQNFPNCRAMNSKDSIAAIGGNTSEFYVSYNNCETWQKKSVPSGNVLQIQVVTKDTFYIIHLNILGSTRVYRTANAGNTWQLLNIGGFTMNNYVHFINSSIGFVTTPSAMFKTTNGGDTWQWVPNGVSAGVQINFIGQDTGFVYSNWQIFRTVDQGLNWTSVKNNIENIYSFHFPTNDTGYAAGEYGVSYRTNDRGTTWENLPIDSYTYGRDIHSIFFTSANTGFSTGKKGQILKTIDGGLSWQNYSITYLGNADVSFVSKDTGYALLLGALYLTADGGQNWSPINIPSDGFADHLYFINKDEGILTTTSNANMYRTNNGGTSWTPVSFPYSFEQFTDVTRFDHDTAYFLGQTYYAKRLFRTTNAFQTVEIISDEFLNKIEFLNKKTGYAVNESRLLRTQDSGRSWLTIYTSPIHSINAIGFINEAKGFIAMSNTLYTSVDSGKTWSPVVTNPNDSRVESINFHDSLFGYFTTDKGSVYSTVNGGDSWEHSIRIPSNICKNIRFGNDMDVYVAGDGATVLRSKIQKFVPLTTCGSNQLQLTVSHPGSSSSWQVDTGNGYSMIFDGSVYSGTSTPGLTINNIPTEFNGYKYRCVYSSPPSLLHTVEFIIKIENKWTGQADNSWENTANWSCGSLPDQHTSVVIESGNVLINSNVTIQNLTVKSGASVTVSPGYTLTLLKN